MNSTLVTTGLVPLTIGSLETFVLQAFNNGLPWDLTGGSATVLMADPQGGSHSYTAAISGSTARISWTVLPIPGDWRRCWDVTDGSGTRQVSRPIPFTVISSP
jgi:hypothetical protein